MTKIGLIAVVSPRYPALRVVITTAPNSTMTRNRSRAFRHGTGSWHVDMPVCERARGHARALLAQSIGEAQGGKVRFLAFALKLASMSLRSYNDFISVPDRNYTNSLQTRLPTTSSSYRAHADCKSSACRFHSKFDFLSSRDNSTVTSRSPQCHFDFTSARRRRHFESISNPLRSHFGIILFSCQVHFGVASASL